MSLLSNAHLDTKVVHSLVDSFFEGKKALVKERLMESVRVIVDGLFEEMVGQVKEMLLPSKSAGNDQEKPAGVATVTASPVKTTSSSLSLTEKPKNELIFATKSKPYPFKGLSANLSSSAAPQPFSGLYKRMAEDDGAGISNNTGSQPSKKKAVTVELQIGDPPNDDYYADIALNDGAGGSGDAELVNNIDIASIHVPNTSKEQQEQLPTQSGKHPCTEPNCGKHFSCNADLKRHLRTHSNAKPFGCTFPGCSGEFSQRHSAIRHILNVHLKKEKPGDEGEENNNGPPDPATYLSVKKELL